MVDCVWNQTCVVVPQGGQGQTVKQVRQQYIKQVLLLYIYTLLYRQLQYVYPCKPLEAYNVFALLTDIDECSCNTSECNYYCTRTDGWYFCTCQDDVMLGTDTLVSDYRVYMVLIITAFRQHYNPTLILYSALKANSPRLHD